MHEGKKIKGVVVLERKQNSRVGKRNNIPEADIKTAAPFTNQRRTASLMEANINSSEDYYYYEANYTLDYNLHETICLKEELRKFNKSFLPTFYSIVFLLGLPGNSLVVVIYAYLKKLKTRTDIYIVHLATADLLLLFTLPFWAASAVHGWIFGFFLCKITTAIYTMTFSASMLFLACVSVDRYCAIFKPLSQPHGAKLCSKTCTFVWMAAMFLSIPDLIFNEVKELHGQSGCISTFPGSIGKTLKLIIEIVEITLSFALPFFVMLICYSFMARALIKSPSAKKSQPLKVLAAVVSVFIVTQMPYNIVKFWKAVDLLWPTITDCSASKAMDVAFQVTNSIALFHSCLNPLLYFFMGASFKLHMVKLAKRYGYWRRQQGMVTEEIAMGYEDSASQTSSFTI